MVESRPANAFFSIDKDELLCAITEVVAIPKTSVVLKPMRRDLGFVNAALWSAKTAPAAAALFDRIDAIGCRNGVVGSGRGARRSNKSQIPNSKSQKNPKTQAPNYHLTLTQPARKRTWQPCAVAPTRGLEFGAWNFFGIWDLRFGILEDRLATYPHNAFTFPVQVRFSGLSSLRYKNHSGGRKPPDRSSSGPQGHSPGWCPSCADRRA